MEGWESALDMTMTLCGFSGAVILFFTLTEMRDLMYALEKKGVSHVTSYVILASMHTITDLKKLWTASAPEAWRQKEICWFV